MYFRSLNAAKNSNQTYRLDDKQRQYLSNKEASIGRLKAHCDSQGGEEKMDQLNNITGTDCKHNSA